MTISGPAVDNLRSALRGQVLCPGDPGYDTARRIFNAMIDRRPVLIARCAGAADVVAAVQFARAEALEVSVRGGGHNVSGKAVGEGLMIDLSPMKGVRVDPRRRLARAEAGCTLFDLDRDTQRFGLATPLGVVSATGIAGLTLGGGIGWLGGRHGLACDNVLSVDLVTADGDLLTVSTDEHPDLFWAVRGGGGNFGVVTSFEYQLHEVGPVIGIGVAWIGPLDEGERHLKPLRSFGTPLADLVQPTSYVDKQRAGDSIYPPGRRHYWKAGFIRRLGPDAIDVLIDFFARRPSQYAIIALQQMHGAAARVSPAATAFAHRHDQWECMMLGQWERPEDDERCIAWTRELYARMEPHLERAVYVNSLDHDEPERVPIAYGSNYDRLAAIKARYDPG